MLYFILLLCALLISLYKILDQSKKRRLIEFNLKQQQIQDLLQENKILGLSSIIEEQDRERIRIGKDLHDVLGVLLSSVQRNVQNVHEEVKKLTGRDMLSDTEKLVANACEEAHRISHDLIPDTLINLDLKEAIMDLAEQIESIHNIHFKVNFGDQLSLTASQIISLYRIVMEATNNSIQHADASQITLSIQRREDLVYVVISDNGKGFKLDLEPKKSGTGISNIVSRAHFLKGSLVFDSIEGSKFEIKFLPG